MFKASVVLFYSMILSSLLLAQAANPLILDADSANEIDDLYAIAYLLKKEDVNLVGITSAQWFHLYSGDSTMWQSHTLNQALVALAGKTGKLPVVPGADRIMGDPWGGYTPRKSAATDFILAESKKLLPGQKLDVMCIGASTNLASALALDSTLHQRVRVWLLGFKYDANKGIWDKDEFNIRRDLNAANFLLNCHGLELHVMPISVARQYTWQQAETYARLDRSGAYGRFLKQKWEERFQEAESWVMWDVALLQAYLKPTQALEKMVDTPPENTQRKVHMYVDIEEQAMLVDYWEVLLD